MKLILFIKEYPAYVHIIPIVKVFDKDNEYIIKQMMLEKYKNVFLNNVFELFIKINPIIQNRFA